MLLTVCSRWLFWKTRWMYGKWKREAEWPKDFPQITVPPKNNTPQPGGSNQGGPNQNNNNG